MSGACVTSQWSQLRVTGLSLSLNCPNEEKCAQTLPDVSKQGVSGAPGEKRGEGTPPSVLISVSSPGKKKPACRELEM